MQQSHLEQPLQKIVRKALSQHGFSYPKKVRILSRGHFQRMLKSRQKLSGQFLNIAYCFNKNSTHPKLGITVSRKYGKAHERNRFKRLVREAFRHRFAHFPRCIEMNISPRMSIDSKLKMQIIIEELSRLTSNWDI